MPHKLIKYKPIGMNRDLSISAANPKYAYTINNMRIINNEETGDLSLTNEKGTEFITRNSGIIIGSVSTTDKLVLFCTDTVHELQDSILLFDGTELTTLYYGNLGFNTDHPIEGLYSYDNNLNEKIYWTDGLNLPRVINLKGEIKSDNVKTDIDTLFDFVSPINKPFRITITKNYTGGTLSPGVIQYAFTYIRNHGQESNIFHTTPLWYVSHNDRGASAEEVVPNSFKIYILNNSTNKERVTVYSIQRTSLNTTPIIRRVGVLDIEANLTNSIIDKGLGESLEASSLYYIGGEDIVCETLNQKDGTLFLGNITLNLPFIEGINDYFRQCADKIILNYKNIKISNEDSVYPYKNQLDDNSYRIKTFKYLEYYRLGVLLQYKTGKWSNPIFITDYYIAGKIDDGNNFYDNTGKDTYIKVPKLTLDLSNAGITDYIKNLLSHGYINIRPVIVYPDLNDRESICQGVLCPTVFNLKERYDGTTFSQASWFFRPNIPTDITTGEHDYLSFDELSNTDYTYSRSGLVANDDNLLEGLKWERRREIINKGAWAEFRHFKPIPGNDKRNAEILCIFLPLLNLKNTNTPSAPKTKDIIDVNSEYYYIDLSIVTMHSPDIEFDLSLLNLDLTGTKLRIVGLVPITSNISDIDIKTSSHTGNVGSTRGSGFYHTIFKSTNDFLNTKKTWDPHWGYRMMLSGFFWYDYKYIQTTEDGSHHYGGYKTGSLWDTASDIEFPFAVYPWHRNGSLNNMKEAKNGFRSSMLKTKRMSNMRYSYRTLYLDKYTINALTLGPADPLLYRNYLKYDLSDALIFNSNENQILKLNKLHDSLEDIIYRGNVDSVVVPSLLGEYRVDGILKYITTKYHKDNGYPIIYGDKLVDSDNYSKLDTFRAPYYYFFRTDSNTLEIQPGAINDLNTGIDPVLLKYKSSPHLVLPLKYQSTGEMFILPTITEFIGNDENLLSSNPINRYAQSHYEGQYWLWDKNDENNKLTTNVLQFYIEGSKVKGELEYPDDTLGYGWLWLGELYRENVSERFGGTSLDALANNNWQVAGETVSLLPLQNDGENVIIEWVEGDTFYQRYDCLKTYPYSNEDLNLNTEILSFMCETRVNLDGRYDRNRGLDSNLTVSPINFNLINDVYSLSNNYFNYSILKKEQFDISRFPNLITWTKTKLQGLEIDNWTNITLASTIDLDGNKGKITSIQKLNNNIIVFLDKGVSLLLYNEKVQVNTQDGVPIEIANSGKVDGYRLLSGILGCSNKWSIQNTKKGLYFVDDYNKDIVFFNGQFKSLSKEKGFNSWIKNHINSASQAFTLTTPSWFGNIITHYDKITDDIYFVTDTKALNYSEVLDEFQAFLSYGGAYKLFNLKRNSYIIQNDLNNHEYSIYQMYAGDYNNLLGHVCGYGIEILVNPDPTQDKIFNTVEFRSDTWYRGSLTNDTFDYLSAKTEYQHGTSVLQNQQGLPSNLKRKFRIWRANIPRDDSNNRDRIRNTWARIRLDKNNPGTKKTILHDIQVNYFV